MYPRFCSDGFKIGVSIVYLPVDNPSINAAICEYCANNCYGDGNYYTRKTIPEITLNSCHCIYKHNHDIQQAIICNNCKVTEHLEFNDKCSYCLIPVNNTKLCLSCSNINNLCMYCGETIQEKKSSWCIIY